MHRVCENCKLSQPDRSARSLAYPRQGRLTPAPILLTPPLRRNLDSSFRKKIGRSEAGSVANLFKKNNFVGILVTLPRLEA